MISWQKAMMATSALGMALVVPGLSVAGGVHASNIIIHPDPPYTTPPIIDGGGFSTFPVGGSSSEVFDGDTITVSVSTTQITISVDPSFSWGYYPGLGGLDLVFSDYPAITSVTKDGASTAPVSNSDVAGLLPTEVQFDFVGETWSAGHTVAIFDYTTQGPPIPEPAAWIMMLMGFAGIGAAARRRAATTASLAS